MGYCTKEEKINGKAFIMIALLVFLFSGAWGSCTTTYVGKYIKGVADFNSGCEAAIGMNGCTATSAGGLPVGGSCEGSLGQSPNVNGYFAGYTENITCRYSSGCNLDLGCSFSICLVNYATCSAIVCTTECEADSIACVNSGTEWIPGTGGQCGYCNNCDEQCQCEESGGAWEPSNGGYCVPQCQSQFCCDSLNQNLPSKVDTTWEGCVATDPANDRCVVLPTVENNTGSTSAECTAKSRYRICTTSYVWNRTAGQCAPISTNNCINQDVSDSRCTKVLCEAYQTRSVSALQYNGSTECYEGYQLVQDMMVCDNGIREERGRSTENFQVCDSYLEANNMTIQDYLSGQNGGYASTGGNGAGPGGGESGGGSGGGSAGCVGNGCGSGALGGGTSVNALGDTVQNSASPQLGNGIWTPQQQLVTSYDSTTGTTTIVQNSSGGDSVRTAVTPSGVRCLGVSGGVATLTNGYSTWTCEGVQSCSQAVISASINGGKCSASGNGVFIDNYNNDNLPLILDENGNAVLTSENDNLERAMQSLASVLNGIAHKDTLNRQKVAQQNRNHDDSLWKATFGDGLDAVRNMEDYIASASSANSQAIAEASSANSQAISSAASKVATAVGNASADITGSIGNMKLNIREGIDTTNKRLDRILSASSQASSVNSQGFGDVVSAVNNARSANSQAINSVASMYRDSVHNTNSYLTGIYNALDTNGIIQKDLNKINSSIGGVASSVDSAFRVSMDEWYNDKLKVTMDSNATRIVDALDALQVEVQLDSIKIDMPKDSIVDSIHAAVRPNGNWNFDGTLNDSVNFGEVMQTVFDSTVGDTSFVMDSSFSEHMKQVASTTIDGSDVSDTEVDSLENTMSAKFDTSQAKMNLRSDTAVAAYKDTLMKYYGGDSIGRALNDFFGGYSDECPRNCLNVTLNHQVMTGGKDMTINFARYICDMSIIGNYSILDFLKLILRVMTAYLCMILILSVVPLGKAGGKK